MINELQEFNELMKLGNFDKAKEHWEGMNLLEKIVKVQVSDRFSFQATHDALKWDKEELRDKTKFRFLQKIREGIDKLADLKETTHYRGPVYIEHEMEMIIIKPTT